MFLDLAEGRLTRHDVVEAYLWLIPVNVGRFGPRFREDLEQEGVIALYRAVDLFDIGRGLRFSTYAVHWLKQGFHSWLYDHGSTVRIPVYMRKAMVRIAKGEDVADLNEATIERARALNEQIMCPLDEATEGGEEDPPGNEELTTRLKEAMRHLSPRERRILRCRYLDGMKYREIGALESVSLERVRQLIARALVKMRTRALREVL